MSDVRGKILSCSAHSWRRRDPGRSSCSTPSASKSMLGCQEKDANVRKILSVWAALGSWLLLFAKHGQTWPNHNIVQFQIHITSLTTNNCWVPPRGTWGTSNRPGASPLQWGSWPGWSKMWISPENRHEIHYKDEFETPWNTNSWETADNSLWDSKSVSVSPDFLPLQSVSSRI